jgi:hypothetical protein
MKPKDYVHLLYDDATFSRSRFYFWAIRCLMAFEASITNNLERFEVYRENELGTLVKYINDPQGTKLKNEDRKIHEGCKELAILQKHIKEQLKTIESLRDGVGSASLLSPQAVIYQINK